MTSQYPKSHGNFDLLIGPVKDSTSEAEVVLWRSRKSGLKVALVADDGPLVEGYFTGRHFTFGSHRFSSSGRPHTLEHLIFLGSEKYPYKGVLDTLANRSFAQGTNAWTDTTHTCYTMSTAGQEGFLKLLPVYVDHLLYPTLTDSGFTTEVFHINGLGQEAGVVFSEMQGRENTSYDLMALQTQRLIYPEGSGYRSETGGLMEKLRVLDCQQIRDYHSHTYVPHNVLLLVVGSVNPQELLETLQRTVEISAEGHGQAHGPTGPSEWKRPWVETPSAYREPRKLVEKIDVIEFPDEEDDEEGMGEVVITWLGPLTRDFLSHKALDILSDYLADSAISPFYKELVDIDEPICTHLYFSLNDAQQITIDLNLSSVPVGALNSVTTKVKALLKKVQNDGIDMARMKAVLRRNRAKILDSGETSLPSSFADSMISDFLYGQREGEDIPHLLNDLQMHKELDDWGREEWLQLLRKWLIQPEFVAVVGKPSEKLSEELKEASKRRLEETKKTYGEEGLKKLDEALKSAQEKNDRKIPVEMLKSFRIPNVDQVRWYDVKTARSRGVAKDTKDLSVINPELQSRIDEEGTSSPYFIQFDHVKSNFVTIRVYMYPSNVPEHLLALLAIWNAAFYHLPLVRADGRRLEYEEVITGLDEDTVEYSAHTGWSALQELMAVRLKVEKDNYEKGVHWMRDLLWGSEFDLDLIKIEATKLRQSLSAEKRDGATMASALFDDMTLESTESLKVSMGMFALMEYMPAFFERLEEDPAQLKKDFEQLRRCFVDPANMRISVIGDIAGLKNPSSTFASFKCDKDPIYRQPYLAQAVLSELGKNPSKRAIILAMGSIESSHAYHACKGPTAWDHPDIPALLVLQGILNDMENFFWRNVRGEGLAYGCSISLNIDTGLVYLNIYRAPMASKAFLAAKELVDRVERGEIEIDDITIESVKSSLEKTRPKAASSSFINQALKGVGPFFKRDRLSLIATVTPEDCLRVLKKWVSPLFNPATSIAAVAASKATVGDIEDALKNVGYQVEVRTLAPTNGDGSEEESDFESEEESNSEE
ncbi:hypothetical protein BT69DRAFT_1285256 [Atractiella rhizophila]|nr:hypothetical protein BT69DRAFT_1285256 [Atractiella rhizophila]